MLLKYFRNLFRGLYSVGVMQLTPHSSILDNYHTAKAICDPLGVSFQFYIVTKTTQ